MGPNNNVRTAMSITYPVIPAAAARARVNLEKYQDMYRQSVADDEAFWAGQARRINWIRPFSISSYFTEKKIQM